MRSFDPSLRSRQKRFYRNSSKLNTINNQLQAYVSGFGDEAGTAVISELLQNADDAGASTVIFAFFPEYLEVRNDSVFTETDFENITELMSRGKERETGKTGTFGAGFISTYHFTDYPRLESSGEWIVFDPTRDELESGFSDIGDKTIFRFPWRREETEIARAIGARTWSDADVAAMRDSLGPVLYRLAIFLRHVRSIEVYEREANLLYQINRIPGERAECNGITRTHWEISSTVSERPSTIDPWLYYTTTIPNEDAPARYTVKDFQVTLAFPIRSRSWLDQHLPATLYNFLPTSIHTGLGFQINGSFFPSDNRRNILHDEIMQAEKVAWNQRVIRALGHLFVAATIDIRDQVVEPARFYDLLPLSYASAYGYLKPIMEVFCRAVPNLSVVRTTRNKWLPPHEVRYTSDDDLYDLLADHVDLLPQDAKAEICALVKQPNRPALTLDDLLTIVTPALRSGVKPGDGLPHPIIDSRAKLNRLYSVIQRQSDCLKGDDAQKARQNYVQVLQPLPIYLAEDGFLYRGDEDHWCGNDEVRTLGLRELVRFVDHQMQAQFSFLSDVLRSLSGAELVREYISELLPKKEGFSVDSEDVPVWLRGRTQCVRVLRYIAADLEPIKSANIANLPIILDENGLLWSGCGKVRRLTDDNPNLLRQLGLPFVDAVLYADDTILPLYQRAGLSEVKEEDVVALLEEHYRLPSRIDLPEGPLRTVEELRELFEYLYRRVETPMLLERLRALALVPTVGGRLASPSDSGAPLTILEEHSKELASVLCDVLQLDVLIDPAVLKGNGIEFLTGRLGIERLSALSVVRDYLIRRYHDTHVTEAGRLTLLCFLRGLHQDQAQQNKLRTLLRSQPDGGVSLVRCRDSYGTDCYAAQDPVYCDTSLAHAVFDTGFWRPHEIYDATWKGLLEALGVKAGPSPAVVAKRLLTLSRKADEPSPVLYDHLASNWDQLSPNLQRQLRTAAVLWDGKRYWEATQIYPDAHETCFGHRRMYRAGLSHESTRLLFDRIGAVSVSLSWTDHLTFVKEIAADYADGQPVAYRDRQLLLHNMARLDPAQWQDTPTALDADAVAALRRYRLIIAVDGCLRAVDDPDRPLRIPAGSGAEITNIPAALSGCVALVADDAARDGRGFLERVLHIETISPFVVVRDAFAKAYLPADDQTRMALLSYLSDIWGHLSLRETKTLQETLKDLLLVHADDREYHPPGRVSFASSVLDRIFAGRYGRPPCLHPDYRIPSRPDDPAAQSTWNTLGWVRLLSALGVHELPPARDTIAALETIAAQAETPTDSLIAALEPIVDWISITFTNGGYTQHDCQELSRLSTIRWVPGRHNARAGWYLPREVYLRDVAPLVGPHAPVLSLHEDLPNDLATLLGFPQEPPVAVVATQLLSLHRQRQTPPSQRALQQIYRFLGRHWTKLSRDQQRRLRVEPVIWYKSQFWESTRTLLPGESGSVSELRRLFGHRRAVVQMEDGWQQFLRSVQVGYDPIMSHTELLAEIAQDYVDGSPLRTADHALILHTLDYLGRRVEALQHIEGLLLKIRFLPGTDRQLYQPDRIVIAEESQHEMRELFRETPLAVLADRVLVAGSGDEPRTPEVRLSEAGFGLLRRLGVGLLAVGGCVERELAVEPAGCERPTLANQLCMPVAPFSRILRTSRDRGYQPRSHAFDLARLKNIQVRACDDLPVRYVVVLPTGVRIEAPEVKSESAIIQCDDECDILKLYALVRKDRIAFIDVALEIERRFMPESGASIVIEHLLRYKNLEEAQRYLNRRHFLDERGQQAVEDDDTLIDEEGFSTNGENIYDPQPDNVTARGADEGETASNGTPSSASEYAGDTEAGTGGNSKGGDSKVAAGGSQEQGETAHRPEKGGGRQQGGNAPTGEGSPGRSSGSHPTTPTADRTSSWSPAIPVNAATIREALFVPEPKRMRQTAEPRTTTSGAPTIDDDEPSVDDQLSQADRVAIGHWGEEYVFRYLCDTLKSRYPGATLDESAGNCVVRLGSVDVAKLRWCNYDGVDRGVGRDIDLEEGDKTTYCEVKATSEDHKSWFDVTKPQWDLAVQKGSNYRIYRVFAAGDPRCRLMQIDDPFACWQRGELAVNPLRIQL